MSPFKCFTSMVILAQTRGVLLLCLIAEGVLVAEYWRVSANTGSRQLLRAQVVAYPT